MSDLSEKKPVAVVRRRWRKALPLWVQLVLFLVVFGAGGVIGAVISLKSVYSRLDYYRQHPAALPDEVLPRLKKRLDLSDQQAAAVDRIFRKGHARMLALHGQVSADIHKAFNAMAAEIEAELETRQKRKWRETHERVSRIFLPPLYKPPADGASRDASSSGD